MNIDDDVLSIINKINSGELDSIASALDGSDFGVFLPVYVNDDGTIKMMEPGYTQTETNLKITVQPTTLSDRNAKTIAWLDVGKVDQWSACEHPKTGTRDCSHQNGHGNCIHCSGHNKAEMGLKTAEGLDYFEAIKQLDNKLDILKSLAPENIGLTLLHAHSDEHEFTKLPPDIVSVIYDGVTSFRKLTDVKNDQTFVPNAWRFIDGKLEISGGFSQKSE
ncbi:MULTISPECIES: hypothetical protein [Acinetobacter]|uniref:hypothetical protein n=1 Tax=Acinetobacter TaxID=469 RepID=UPI0014441D89|nr:MULTISPECIES: hypothetical protein [Acinetobacter]